jgi:AcrR family transcriptional regulator
VREQSSLQTRDAILDAAAVLLGKLGYAKTTIAEVARRAGVATNTIYANVGGKPEVFLALLERATSASIIEDTLVRIDATSSAVESIELTAFAYRSSFELAGSVISVLDEAALHDDSIAKAVDESQQMYQRRLDRVGAHLRSIDALKSGLSDAEVSDVLWFYFGFVAWPQLIALKWSPERIEAWLSARAIDALLALPHDRS